MVCSLCAHLSGFVCGIPTSATHSDSPTKVITYDFIRTVSLSGHSQYLAACAKMTPWQRDCKMPSTRMGALVGTSIWVANEGVMMQGRLVPAVVTVGPLMRHFWSNWPARVGRIGCDQPEVKCRDARSIFGLPSRNYSTITILVGAGSSKAEQNYVRDDTLVQGRKHPQLQKLGFRICPPLGSRSIVECNSAGSSLAQQKGKVASFKSVFPCSCKAAFEPKADTFSKIIFLGTEEASPNRSHALIPPRRCHAKALVEGREEIK
ncbi:hypothetical protein BC827DRAFT_1153261 [Russula dissimulans]|nr:hypothetical protein BC827DRAFT_1153261 [Russula dissimulans]